MARLAPDQFGSLRKLLALKKYENPPPGFFDEFPDRVVARIQLEDLRGADSLWQRFFNTLTLRPAAAAAYGLALTGFCAAGLALLSPEAQPGELYQFPPMLAGEVIESGTPLAAGLNPISPGRDASSVAPVFERNPVPSPLYFRESTVRRVVHTVEP